MILPAVGRSPNGKTLLYIHFSDQVKSFNKNTEKRRKKKKKKKKSKLSPVSSVLVILLHVYQLQPLWLCVYIKLLRCHDQCLKSNNRRINCNNMFSKINIIANCHVLTDSCYRFFLKIKLTNEFDSSYITLSINKTTLRMTYMIKINQLFENQIKYRITNSFEPIWKISRGVAEIYIYFFYIGAKELVILYIAGLA